MIPNPWSDEPEYPSPPPPRPFAWVTWTLVATTVGVFVLQLVELRRYHEDVVGDTLAFSPQALAEGRYYTLLTYAWAHAVAMFGDSGYYWLHIVANMIPLACLGPVLEEFLGHARYLGLYLGGAIFSVLVWYFFNFESNEPIIGASGAVFAVIAGVGTAAPRERVMVFLFFIIPTRMSLATVALVICGIEAVLILFAHIPLLEPYSMPDVAHSAHLAGAAFGVCYTWLMLPKEGLRASNR
jgi:membrane associated rhomboid family serine protease